VPEIGGGRWAQARAGATLTSMSAAPSDPFSAGGPFDAAGPTVDPNAASRPDSGLFGVDPDPETSAVWVLPVPFDATTSYRPGARFGPDAVARASHQVELWCPLFGEPWRRGIALREVPAGIVAAQEEAFEPARRVVEVAGYVDGDAALLADLERVNAAGERVNAAVEAATVEALSRGKLPVLLGGDHATPFGALAAVSRRHPGVGVLHIDAHADLRLAFEGFTWSHASILRNACERLDGIAKVVQIGIRDTCPEENDYVAASGGRIEQLTDEAWGAARLAGLLPSVTKEWIAKLPDEIYLTMDVDGLDPVLCPNTGTPVPGGLRWDELSLLLTTLRASGKRVVGLDLVEVSPGEDGGPTETDSWDANVGARALYRLIGAAVAE
jgi:agmatinase